MQTRLATIGLLTALAAVGCGTSGTAPGTGGRLATPVRAPGNCSDTSPQIVNINNVTLSGANPRITVNPGQQLIDVNGQWVRWQIAGNQYSFTADGVSFPASKNTAPPPMSASAPTGSGDVYDICFGNTGSTTKGVWPYDIKLFANASPGVIWKCDPTIVNSASLEVATPLVVHCTPQ